MGFDNRESAKKYVRRDGDTLETIAQRESQGEPKLTGQDIAKFNFGTDDPDTVDEFLRDELGTVRRDASNHFIISANDRGPGELLIPKPFKKAGLPVDQTHVLRVNAKEAPPQFIACFGVPGITFAFDKSYVRTTVVDQLERLEIAANNHPDARIMIFGHTDKVGPEDYNKKLSERRAKSVYAFIINDVDAWEQLYNEESWGIKVIQDILQTLGRYSGPIHGVQDQPTTDAIKQFQRDKGLKDDGIAGPDTRRALFTDYMSGAHNVQIEADRFMDPKHMGCGEFNPEEDTEKEHEPNRRVMFYLFHQDRLPKLPCKKGDLSPCRAQMKPPAPRFRKTFKCSFYDSMTRQCPNERQPTTKPGTIKLTSPGIEDDKKVSHGAGVALNDDHDGAQFQGSTPAAGTREWEPIFDLDFLGSTPGEDDLLEIKLSMDEKPITGSVELKITEGADKLRVWPKATKGPAAEVMTPPLTIPIADLPKKLFLEGIKTGKVTLEAKCTHPRGTTTDSLVVNVMTLHETQGGDRKILYEYNSDIEFEVEGAPANYTFEWDLDGDGSFNTSVAEKANTTATAKCKYGLLDDASTVLLPRTPANRRKVIPVGVRLTGGLVLRVKGTTTGMARGMRVSLGTPVGVGIPAQSTAGIHTIYKWSDTNPVKFVAVTPAQQTEFENDDGVSLPITGTGRIQYGTKVTDYAVTPRDGVGDGRRFWLVAVGGALWTQGMTREDLEVTVNHEIRHLEQHHAVRYNSPSGNEWRLIDNFYAPSAGVNGYSDFREAHGHHYELTEVIAAWYYHLRTANLENFKTRYDAAMKIYEDELTTEPAKSAAKRLLQDFYRRIPFAEMKRPEYEFYVRAPK